MSKPNDKMNPHQDNLEETVDTVEQLDQMAEQAANEAGQEAAVDDAMKSSMEEDPMTLLTRERDDMRDKLMRALAEAENTRKRAEKMQSDTQKFAVAGFAKDMLDIADNLRRALDAINEEQQKDDTVKTLYDGVAATEKIMLGNFEKHGIQKIAPEDGKFDPNFHEVMFEADVPGKNPGEIIQLLEVGYVLNGRLLRPARVGVAKSSGESEHKVDTQA
jgi:molecular chaperone GrpE